MVRDLYGFDNEEPEAEPGFAPVPYPPAYPPAPAPFRRMPNPLSGWGGVLAGIGAIANPRGLSEYVGGWQGSVAAEMERRQRSDDARLRYETARANAEQLANYRKAQLAQQKEQAKGRLISDATRLTDLFGMEHPYTQAAWQATGIDPNAVQAAQGAGAYDPAAMPSPMPAPMAPVAPQMPVQGAPPMVPFNYRAGRPVALYEPSAPSAQAAQAAPPALGGFPLDPSVIRQGKVGGGLIGNAGDWASANKAWTDANTAAATAPTEIERATLQTEGQKLVNRGRQDRNRITASDARVAEETEKARIEKEKLDRDIAQARKELLALEKKGLITKQQQQSADAKLDRTLKGLRIKGATLENQGKAIANANAQLTGVQRQIAIANDRLRGQGIVLDNDKKRRDAKKAGANSKWNTDEYTKVGFNPNVQPEYRKKSFLYWNERGKAGTEKVGDKVYATRPLFIFDKKTGKVSGVNKEHKDYPAWAADQHTLDEQEKVEQAAAKLRGRVSWNEFSAALAKDGIPQERRLRYKRIFEGR